MEEEEEEEEEGFSKACEIARRFMERGGRVSWGTRRRLGNATTNVCQRSRIRIVYTVTTDRGAITSSAKFSFALPLRSLPRRKAEESSNAAR